MKVLVDYDDTNVLPLKIESAKYLSNYAVQIQFNDGTERLVDFKSFLTKSFHPSIRKYLNEDVFSKFKIVTW